MASEDQGPPKKRGSAPHQPSHKADTSLQSLVALHALSAEAFFADGDAASAPQAQCSKARGGAARTEFEGTDDPSETSSREVVSATPSAVVTAAPSTNAAGGAPDPSSALRSLLTTTSFNEDKWLESAAGAARPHRRASADAGVASFSCPSFSCSGAASRVRNGSCGSCDVLGKLSSSCPPALSLTSSSSLVGLKTPHHKPGPALPASASASAAPEGVWSHERQRRTRFRLVRVYPRGLRTKSDNYDPLPCWASGVQLTALNLQTNDLATQLHYALFELNGGSGFVEKPEEMLTPTPCWPPPRLELKVVTVQPITLFNLPKRNEERPFLEGGRSAAHEHVSELSFSASRPRKKALTEVPLPSVAFELHAIGGFHCVSTALPPSTAETRHVVQPTFCADGDAHYAHSAHCVAAEPLACVLRVAVVDEEFGKEVAYDTVVLGAVREGYR
eukprot:232270-Pleurochrysis_carterae.AAC.1